MNAQNSGFTPSRRTLVKGAAWSVPVVAVAGAVPAFAASLPFEIKWGNACKLPGNSGYVKKGYRFYVCFKNTQNTTYEVTFTGFSVNNVAAPQWWPAGVTLGPNEEECFFIDAGPYDDSANGQACLSLTWTNARGQSGEGSSCTYVNDLPPCECRDDDCEDPGTPAQQSTTKDESAEVKLDEASEAEVTVEEPVVETQGESAPAEVEAPAEVGTEQSGTDAATATEAPSSNG